MKGKKMTAMTKIKDVYARFSLAGVWSLMKTNDSERFFYTEEKETFENNKDFLRAEFLVLYQLKN
jgi:hypothetical protein